MITLLSEAGRARCNVFASGNQAASSDILDDLCTERFEDNQSDTGVAKVRIAALQLDNGANE